jgi:hypothetical protein
MIVNYGIKDGLKIEKRNGQWLLDLGTAKENMRNENMVS